MYTHFSTDVVDGKKKTHNLVPTHKYSIFSLHVRSFSRKKDIRCFHFKMSSTYWSSTRFDFYMDRKWASEFIFG